MVRSEQVARYLKVIERYGIDADALLAGSGVDAAVIARADGSITLDQYLTIVANLGRLSGDPCVGFEIAQSMTLNDFGLVGYAMLSTRTFRDAAEVWVGYSNALVGQHVRTCWNGDRDGHELSFMSPMAAGTLHRFEVEQAIGFGCMIVRELTGTAPVFKDIAFSYAAQPHQARYEELLKCPMHFNAPRTVVRFISPPFDTPVKARSEEVIAAGAEHCGKVMPLQPEATPLLSRLRTLFLARPGQLPDVDAASRKLGMSVSTLLRKLDATGQSYQAVKDGFRFDLARQYLRSSHLPPKLVACLMGFSSPSNFNRAFKAWSGLTVSEFLRAEGR